MQQGQHDYAFHDHDNGTGHDPDHLGTVRVRRACRRRCVLLIQHRDERYVNVTLNGVSGAGVPATVQLGLGIGTPAGVDCTVTTSVTAAAGTAPQLTGTFGPGLFCVRVYDVGNLFAPASFSATIAHS